MQHPPRLQGLQNKTPIRREDFPRNTLSHVNLSSGRAKHCDIHPQPKKTRHTGMLIWYRRIVNAEGKFPKNLVRLCLFESPPGSLPPHFGERQLSRLSTANSWRNRLGGTVSRTDSLQGFSHVFVRSELCRKDEPHNPLLVDDVGNSTRKKPQRLGHSERLTERSAHITY